MDGVFLLPVIDCCTREVLGYALELTGKAKTAERALEQALLGRFGTLHNAPPGMLLRHDNGLVFGSRSFRAVVKDYGLKQEYITPYTPQQMGCASALSKPSKKSSVGAIVSDHSLKLGLPWLALSNTTILTGLTRP